MKKNDGGSAFPVSRVDLVKQDDTTYKDNKSYPIDSGSIGMSLRDWFAGKSLQGLITKSKSYSTFDNCGQRLSVDKIKEFIAVQSHSAYLFADAMLKEREK